MTSTLIGLDPPSPALHPRNRLERLPGFELGREYLDKFLTVGADPIPIAHWGTRGARPSTRSSD
jgi:hypothetical protein